MVLCSLVGAKQFFSEDGVVCSSEALVPTYETDYKVS
jgi:hypothetical protein